MSIAVSSVRPLDHCVFTHPEAWWTTMGNTSSWDRSSTNTPVPIEVVDGAQTCVQYVQKNLGIALDYQTETLPVLDHYLREARAQGSPHTHALIASVAGCYLGELLRARHPLCWEPLAQDQLLWSLSAPSITIFPVAMAHVALVCPKAEKQWEVFRFAPPLRQALTRRLQALPVVSDDEYVAPSTRVEVVDMAFEWLEATNNKHAHDHEPAEPEE